MRKLKMTIAAVAVLFAGSAFAQPVSDNGVVPVAVTLNSVLRLNIVSGGNIEFVFNTVEEYKRGKSSAIAGAGDTWRTTVTVAASNAWMLRIRSEDATLLGTDRVGNQMSLRNIGYVVTFDGNAAYNFAGKNVCLTHNAWAAGTSLAYAWVTVISAHTSVGTSNNAGDVVDNRFIFHWAAGRGNTEVPGTNLLSLIDQNLNPDRYVTNVFFNIERLP